MFVQILALQIQPRNNFFRKIYLIKWFNLSWHNIEKQDCFDILISTTSHLILGRFSSFGGLSDGNSVGRGETEEKRKLDRSSQPSRQGKERSGRFFFYYLVLCLIKLEMYNLYRSSQSSRQSKKRSGRLQSIIKWLGKGGITYTSTRIWGWWRVKGR